MKKKEVPAPPYISFILLLLVVLTGVIFFIAHENYSVTEAVYMTVITMATVGFREIKPLTQEGMWFTSFLIIFSIGLFTYAVSTFTRYIVDGVFHNYYKHSRMKKEISSLTGHTIVVGYGRNGSQAIKNLKEYNMPTIIIDSNDQIVEKIQHQDQLYIIGDATEDATLKQARIHQAKALITALPNDSDNLFVVLTAREMNKSLTIISRASNFTSIKKLKSAGATNVIMPDKIGGQSMAKLVAQPDVVEFVEYIMMKSCDEVHLEEISCTNLASCFENKTIAQLGIRNISGANIIGLKRETGSYVFNPSPETILSSKDQLFVLGNPSQIMKLKEIIKKG